MDKLHQMQAFTAVVDAGSFIRAAESLALSKTAVSRLVGELESRLGVRLLHRTTRRLSLTEEGEVFHARCSCSRRSWLARTSRPARSSNCCRSTARCNSASMPCTPAAST